MILFNLYLNPRTMMNGCAVCFLYLELVVSYPDYDYWKEEIPILFEKRPSPCQATNQRKCISSEWVDVY